MTGRRWLIGSLALGLLAAGVVAAWAIRGGAPLGPLWFWERPSRGGAALEALGLYGEVPDFALTDRSGRPVVRADLLGHVWLANFVYTQCTETCPLQSAVVTRLQREFGQPELRFVSITVDPERDTAAALARYAARYDADPVRWLFLTGDKRAIYRLATEGFRLGVVDPDDAGPSAGLWPWIAPQPAWAAHGSKGLVMHSQRLVLVDRRAWIRAYHRPDDEASLRRLRGNLRTLLREA